MLLLVETDWTSMLTVVESVKLGARVAARGDRLERTLVQSVNWLLLLVTMERQSDEPPSVLETLSAETRGSLLFGGEIHVDGTGGTFDRGRARW